jgi:hypothetical protein
LDGPSGVGSPGFALERSCSRRSMDDVKPVVPPVVPTGGISQLRVATNGTHAASGRNGRNVVSGGVGVGCRRIASGGVLGDRGLEPLTSCVSSTESPGQNPDSDDSSGGIIAPCEGCCTSGCTCVCPAMASIDHEGLVAVVAAWPNLSLHIRRVIVTLADSVDRGPGSG